MANPSAKRKSFVELAIGIVALILLYYISSFIHFRYDLTAEKRYTLSSNTIDMLGDLQDIVHVRVYLDGDLPMGFRGMRRELKELLDEFKVHGNRMFQYEFINPSKSTSKAERDALMRDLYDKGLEPTNIQERDPRGGSTQRVVFPGAIVSYKGREIVVNLLKNNPTLKGEENINNSIQAFEFSITSSIHKILPDSLPKLAFVHGHGQLDELETGDIAKELSNQFEVHRVILGGEVGGLNPYSVVIMAGPSEKVSEADKLVLDQYIMGGGSILWLLEGVTVSIDSLSNGATTLAFPIDNNLNDMLFKYGARINPILIQDMQCAVIPVNVSLEGQDSRFAPAPWAYYPLINASPSNPITNHLNPILSKFASSLDTVGLNPEVNKSVLLSTSAYSRTLRTPLFVNLRQIEQSPLEREFTQSHIPVAVLLEGVFSSAFSNRPLSKLNNGKPFNFHERSIPTRMIVISDADIIRNDVSRRADGAYVTPLGYDRYTKQTYGNKELIVNMISYLNDDIDLMKLRNREFKLRLLDKNKVLEQRVRWQLLNLTLPSLILLAFVGVWLLVRRYRFTQ